MKKGFAELTSDVRSDPLGRITANAEMSLASENVRF
jgi:hypothetical protein